MPAFSRKTVRALLDQAYCSLIKQFQATAKELGAAIGLTCDIWTSRSMDPFVGVTMHFLDPKTFETVEACQAQCHALEQQSAHADSILPLV